MKKTSRHSKVLDIALAKVRLHFRDEWYGQLTAAEIKALIDIAGVKPSDRWDKMQLDWYAEKLRTGEGGTISFYFRPGKGTGCLKMRHDNEITKKH